VNDRISLRVIIVFDIQYFRYLLFYNIPSRQCKEWSSIQMIVSSKFKIKIWRFVQLLTKNKLKGVMTWSIVDVLSELHSPFLKGGNSAFLTAIASGLFHKPNIGHSNNYGPNGPNRNQMGSNY